MSLRRILHSPGLSVSAMVLARAELDEEGRRAREVVVKSPRLILKDRSIGATTMAAEAEAFRAPLASVTYGYDSSDLTMPVEKS